MSEPTPLYPWSRTAEQRAEDERRMKLFQALVQTLRVGDRIDFEPTERVVRAEPPSIRSIDAEIEHLGLRET